MEPFPTYRRRIYLAFFVLLFLMVLPAVILYADGWRFKAGFGLVKTGGVYIEVPYAGATVSLNGQTVGQTGFLQRSFYLGDLAPSAYVVRVDREGSRSWGRILVVEPQLVTDARALLIPDEIELTRLAVSDTASSTKIISRAAYDAHLAAFATSTVASSTIPRDESDGIGLFLIDGDVIARWMRTNDIPPSVFCSSPSFCALALSIKRGGGDVVDAGFFDGGVVYRTKEGGVYFVEIDTRSTPIAAQIHSAPGTDMRVIDDTLIIKSGTELYEVEGL